jgi:hypothetical protein
MTIESTDAATPPARPFPWKSAVNIGCGLLILATALLCPDGRDAVAAMGWLSGAIVAACFGVAVIEAFVLEKRGTVHERKVLSFVSQMLAIGGLVAMGLAVSAVADERAVMAIQTQLAATTQAMDLFTMSGNPNAKSELVPLSALLDDRDFGMLGTWQRRGERGKPMTIIATFHSVHQCELFVGRLPTANLDTVSGNSKTYPGVPRPGSDREAICGGERRIEAKYRGLAESTGN